ncbi:MAG TPA: hypothetical protein VFQ62_08360 [Methylomirabilota bacterium]|nr:hypothetical protein [Methylomirabilota bacterium]
MSLMFLVTACAFVAVVGLLVAGIDRWRESRLTVARRVAGVAVPIGRAPSVPPARKRAA